MQVAEGPPGSLGVLAGVVAAVPAGLCPFPAALEAQQART